MNTGYENIWEGILIVSIVCCLLSVAVIAVLHSVGIDCAMIGI